MTQSSIKLGTSSDRISDMALTLYAAEINSNIENMQAFTKQLDHEQRPLSPRLSEPYTFTEYRQLPVSKVDEQLTS